MSYSVIDGLVLYVFSDISARLTRHTGHVGFSNSVFAHDRK